MAGDSNMLRKKLNAVNLDKNFLALTTMTLALKIPPIIQAAICAAAMWLIAREHSQALHYNVPLWLTGLTATAGLFFTLFPALQFHRHSTSIDPRSPGKSSTLITSGIYAISRNPIYTGLLLLLTAWALWLGIFVNALVLAFFYSFITTYQIIPEEKFLAEKFADEYQQYRQKVRRWL
jgi:protein-S-isoprenylcysteine O-methyltransferase Ste14